MFSTSGAFRRGPAGRPLHGGDAGDDFHVVSSISARGASRSRRLTASKACSQLDVLLRHQLLPQPGGFERFLAVGEDMHPRDFAIRLMSRWRVSRLHRPAAGPTHPHVRGWRERVDVLAAVDHFLDVEVHFAEARETHATLGAHRHALDKTCPPGNRTDRRPLRQGERRAHRPPRRARAHRCRPAGAHEDGGRPPPPAIAPREGAARRFDRGVPTAAGTRAAPSARLAGEVSGVPIRRVASPLEPLPDVGLPRFPSDWEPPSHSEQAAPR